jgi:iron complex outermembrane receptor protein
MRFLFWALVTVLLPQALRAQTAEEGAPLEEVTVTAGFRERDLMTLPGSGSVIGSQAIRERAARHLESVLALSPNVGYSSGASRARFVQIRGVGDLEQFVDPKHFPSVGITVDDINLGGTANAAMLFDMDQVEILRGPQGTAFGTSALAGLVNVRGARPSDEFEAQLEVGAGSYGSTVLSGVLNGALGDKLTGRLAAQRHEGDGYIDNRYLERDDTNGYEETAVRGVLEFAGDERANYSLTTMYFDGDNGYDAFSLANDRGTLSDSPGRDAQRTVALAANGEWLLDDLTLEATMTWSSTDLDYGFDEDWTYVGYCDGTFCDPVFDFFSNTDRYIRARREHSLDLRLLGQSGSGALQYVVGVYAQQRDESLHRQYYGDFFSEYETDRTAIYAQIDVGLTDRLDFSSGIRKGAFDDQYSDSLLFRSTSDDTLESGELRLSYRFREGLWGFVTLSRGEKPGGVNTEASSSFPFMQPVFQDFIEPRLRIRREKLTNREVGVKGTLADERLALRAALFDMSRNDAQLESWMWDAQSFLWIGFLDNADGDNRGLELELDYDTRNGASIFFGFGYLDTDVETITVFDLDAGAFRERVGIDQAKSPRWQYNAGVRWPIGSRLHARVEVEGRDDSQYGYYHDQSIAGYDLLNASIAVDLDIMTLQVWGRNLTDQDYAVHALYFGNDPRKGWINETYYQYAEPRVVGVTARFSF